MFLIELARLCYLPTPPTMLNHRAISELIVYNIKQDLLCSSKPYTILKRYLELHSHRRVFYDIIGCIQRIRDAYYRVRALSIGLSQKLTQLHVDALVEYITESIDYYIKELVNFLGYKYSVWVSDSTISCVLKLEDFSYKVVTYITVQRDQELYILYQARVASFYIDMFIFINKFAANKYSIQRKYRQALYRVLMQVTYKLCCSLQQSILLAYTVDSYLDEALII